MPSPTDSTSSLITEFVRTEMALTPPGANLPALLRKPLTAIALPMRLLAACIAAAGLCTGWGLFVVPLGVPAIGLWQALGLALTAGYLTHRIPDPRAMLDEVDDDATLGDDPEQEARVHFMAHCLLLATPLLYLTMWGLLALVGCLV